jgi:hypothetical protein
MGAHKVAHKQHLKANDSLCQGTLAALTLIILFSELLKFLSRYIYLLIYLFIYFWRTELCEQK